MRIPQAKLIIDMNAYFFTSIFALVILGSCASLNVEMTDKGDLNTAIHNAITDFLPSAKRDKADRIYYVSPKSVNQDLFGVSLEATNDKVVVITEDRVNFDYRALPTGYVDRDGKLFYWRDSTKRTTVSDEMILTLRKYNILDTVVVGAIIPESTITHGKKQTHYYFCKSNLLKYKRVRTSIAMGYYTPPTVNCE
jgi:hypothetical protein